MTKRFPQRNDDGLAAGLGKRQLQVAAVFNLSAEFAELIRNGVDHVPSHIGEKYARVRRYDSRIAHIQKLARHDDAVAARLYFQLDIDLKRIRAIEHLP